MIGGMSYKHRPRISTYVMAAKRFIPIEVLNLCELLDFLFANHATPFSVLVGAQPFPEMMDVYDMIIATTNPAILNDRVQGGEFIPFQQRILERCEFVYRVIKANGGEKAIIAGFKRFIKLYPEAYEFLKDTFYLIPQDHRPRGPRRQNAFKLAKKYHMSPYHVRERRNHTVLQLAYTIAFPREPIAPFSPEAWLEGHYKTLRDEDIPPECYNGYEILEGTEELDDDYE